ncbi:hypothetical protein Vqi01_41090 [Micromonospora qiuiae]|uniref:Uncharacterized protein n=2 Tax=Micromonospora qiuiae TaxID=502268 RepID=A0ABQ4JHI0_9ACTN|nr:hypothetical protein Vqi01_41090 [Micromonospora qiuiae]
MAVLRERREGRRPELTPDAEFPCPAAERPASITGMDFLLAFFLVLAISLLLAQMPSRRESARTAYRLAELERRLALVAQHLGVPDPDTLPVESGST